ncbi:matrix metalloproteinase-18-like [Topomyia yanbarensis]|uniref:matrix metalloproteinase-18-like n=1 Tax=Topomyia yanbarensis TaxID=2498891 RepID=UPI00273BEE3A|nr:matrix metalloproteinase-18-like [Topomyia yanbarensis]XP_058840734.1 matrix metalloproteinase-18-like [Topomyia yanbarensis]
MDSNGIVLLLVLITCELCTRKVHSAPSSTSAGVRSLARNKSNNASVDPTEALEIPAVSEMDAEIVLRGLGYNEVDDDPLSIRQRMTESTEQSLTDLIRNFQRDHGLEETGVLDDDTKLVIGSPHCGSKKSSKKADDVMKWNKQSLTYRIENFPRGKAPEPIRRLLTKAFSEWSKVTNLDFQEVDDDDSDIEIGFGGKVHRQRGDKCTFDDSQTLAHAYYPEVGDIHFNSQYFFEGDTSLTDFLDTALHEIGHSLGLEHSRSKASLMHPTESNGFTEPQPMDVEKIQALYGVRRGGRAMGTSGPRLCTLSKIDAAIDDEDGNVYFLAGNYFYNANETRSKGELISTKWPGLPGDIDAAFRYLDGRSYFFKGEKFWRFKGSRLEPGHPRLIKKAFPGLPSNCDAMMVDGDGDIYAFRGSQYWAYDPKSKKVSSSSPSSTRVLGLPSNLDAALDTETTIGAFKSQSYYEAKSNGKFRMTHSTLLVC